MHALGYVRVSKAREDMISPDIQRDEIQRYAVRHDLEVVEWFEDLDLSGRTDERPALQSMLQRAIDDDVDAVIVYRLDRFSREPLHFYQLVHSLSQAGVELHDAGESAYDASPEAEFIRGIKVLIAKQESRNLGKRLKDAHRRLAKEGRWSGGPLPYGFQRVEDEQGARLVAHPERTATCLWMHDRYQAGWGANRIARELNRLEVPTQRGCHWERTTVQVVLFRSIQVGARVVDGELVFGGNIEAIVPLEVYERTLAIHEARRRAPHVGRPPRVPLTGRHVRCGTCGGRLYARYSHRPGVLYYSCMGRVRGLCESGVAVKVDELLPIVEERLFDRLRRARAPRRLPAPELLSPLEDAVRQAEQALGRLSSMYASGELIEAEYRGARQLQLRRLEKAEERLSRALRRMEDVAQAEILEDAWRNLGTMTREQWRRLSVQAQRDIYDLVLDRVVVYPKDAPYRRHKAEPHRVEVNWR
jgi:DNA invertase Pin-like site-specific DNA recombinase